MTDKQIDLINKAIDIVIKWNNNLLNENVKLLYELEKAKKDYSKYIESEDSYEEKIAEEDLKRANEKPWLRVNLEKEEKDSFNIDDRLLKGKHK